MNQVKKNFMYNAFYEILKIIIPLITIPYVSRVLGATGVGIYSYTYSIAGYFMLFSLLGINNYGNRSIAKIRDNKKELSKTFLGIYSIQLFLSFLMLILYLGYVFVFDNQYKLIALLQAIYLISVIFDINWFFFGLEKFKITVIRNSILKILSLILIFLFVNSSNDIWIYTLILSGSTLISQIILWPFLRNEVTFEKISFNDIKNHIKPCLILFIPVIAISLYKLMDKIMLGMMSEIAEVGYYEQAEKIVLFPQGIIAAFGTVMLPRMSNLVAKKEDKLIKEYIDKSINFIMFLAFPICFGLLTISNRLVPIFLGSGFTKSAYLLYFLSFTVLFGSFANVLRTQYLIPKEKDKIYIISVILGAIINLIINLLFIPKYASIGACYGTIMAEFFVMLYQIVALRDELPIIKYLKGILPYFIKSLIMFIAILFINYLDIKNIYIIILQVLCGALIYFTLNIKYIKQVLSK